MHILPPLETVKDIAATQQYDVLPLSCEILSDFITPIEAMRILKNVSTHCYMLESAQADDRWGRYTFLGFDPKLEITCIDGKMKAGGLTVRTDDPTQYLRELLSSYRSPRFDYLPSFTGGLVGYFSYDYLKYSEPSVRCGEQDEDSFKDVDLMLFDKVIAFDHVRQKIVLIVNMALSDVEVGYNKAKLELEQLVSLLKTGEKKQEAPGRLLGEVTPLFSKEQFCAMVETAKHHIREGDIFQIVLSNRLSAPFEGSLLDTSIPRRTCSTFPAPTLRSRARRPKRSSSSKTACCTPFPSLEPVRAAKRTRRTRRLKKASCTTKRSLPSTTCSSTSGATTSARSANSARCRLKSCTPSSATPT